ncbi:hemagglutinin repeat-containing protein [Chromobacterium sp. CV08]|uniref:hemagglutinin repeat-containing protein n=1 Tax=Chromobacterium sp. CV08 TaxID=3133274 RepID=UPI003DA91E6A
MNKQLYRIIFNQARGQLMVVQEDACGQGKGSGADGVAATLAAACKAFSLRLSVLLIGLGLGASALAADIVADPHAPAGKQPGVIQSANGLPVVQIAAPTAAGVSHNQYQQFNVGPGGALLNNSPVNVNTQLAGYISGNANLKNGSARIILNEVTQANPSQLRGYLEVAGQRAQVVIANPWGITCSGCGFINTPQVTLTTGVPQLNAQGALSGYQVAGGRVSIDGAGLNAGNVDSFAIISRAVSVNADLYAQKLDLVLGRNQVDAATLAAQPLPASAGDAPAFALDVAQLGGMYANAIKLVGTEKGVGVNQAGTMAAQAGDLQLSSAGDLILRGKTHSQQNLLLQADGQLQHDGVTRAEGQARIDVAGQSTLHQTLSAGGDLTLNTGSLQGDGALAAGAQADGKLSDHGRLAVTSAGMLQHSGQLLAGGDVSLQAGLADLSQATVSASHGALDLQATDDLNTRNARLTAAGAASLDAGGLLDNRGGQLSAAKVDLRLGALDNRQGKIVQTGQDDSAWHVDGAADNRQGLLASAGRSLSLRSGSLDNRGGEVGHGGAGTLQLTSGALDNREQGRIASDGSLDARAAQLDNRQGRLVGQQGADVRVDGALSNDGGVLGSDGQLRLGAGQLDNGAGLIQSGKDLQLSAAGVTNAGQILALGKDAASQIDVSGDLHNQGKIAGNADLTVNAASVDNSKGTLQAAGHLELSKQSSLSNDGGHIAAQSLNVTADSLTNKTGEIYAQQQLSGRLKTLENSKGSLIGGQAVDLAVSNQLHNDGVLGSDGQVKLTAGKLDNAAGTIQSGKDLQLTAASVTNAGQILALGKDAASKVDVAGELHNQGKLAGNADLTVNAASVDNVKGTLQAAGSLGLTKQTTLTNDGGRVAAQNLNLDADSLSNRAGEIYAQQQLSSQLKTLNNSQGSLIGGQGIDLTVSGQLHNDGVLGSDGQVKLTAGQLDNAAGTIQSGKELQLTADRLSNAGQILALGKDAASQVDVAGELHNQGKLAGNADLTVNAASVDNANGAVQAAGHLELSKQSSLSNDGGRIAGQSLKLDADSLSNRAGEIYAQQQLSSTLKTLDNSRGSLIGSQGVDLAVSNQLHNDGVLGSDGQVKLTAGALENVVGTIQSGKDLQLSAASLSNADKGQILALGKDAASKVDVAGELHNQGKLAGNADLTVNAATVDNSKGTLQAAGQLNLTKQSTLTNDGGHLAAQSLTLNADHLSNQAGEIYAQRQLSSTLKTLDNTKGSLVGGQGVDLTASDKLHNDGTLGSGGQVKLTAGALENVAGTIQSGKDLQLSAASLSNADKGQILALGKDAASKVDVSGDLHNQGKLAGNADLTVNAATVDNANGALQAGGHLELSKQTTLTNDGGHIASQGLNLKADSLSNQAGDIRQIGAGEARLQIGQAFNNQQGQLLSNGGLTVEAGQLDNRQGVLGSQGAQALNVRQDLNNQGGTLASGQALKLTLQGALDNQKGTMQGDSLQLDAAALDNRGGGIKALGAGGNRIALGGKLDNSAAGTLAANGDLTLQANQLDNRGGLLQSAASLDARLAQDAQNGEGKLQAGQLQLSAASLGNQHGLIGQAGGGLAKLAVRGQIDNSKQGRITSAGQLQVDAGDLDNSQGVLSSQGDLTLHGKALNNQQGTLGSNGALTLGAASLDNGGGLLQAGQTLQLDSGSLRNAGGKILALGAGDSRLTISGQLANGGQIAGNGNWQLKLQGLDNGGGSVYGQRNLAIDTVSLANAGTLLSGQDLSLSLQGDFVNNAGTQLQANRNLSISASGNLVNNGQLQSSGNLSLSGVNWTNNGSVNIGGTLSTQLSQGLFNYGSLGAGALNLNAASLSNAASITAGDIAIHAGSLDNGGGKAVLASAGNLSLNIAGTLNNHDGAWLYSQGDMRIGQAGAAAGQVVNHIATLQSDGNMFIEAGRVSNESNPVTVSQSSTTVTSEKTTYQIPTYVTSYTECGHDGMRSCASGYMAYVGQFNFLNGLDLSTQHVYNDCSGNHCHSTPDQVVKYRFVSDDQKNQILTVRRDYDGTPPFWLGKQPEDTMTVYYLWRDGNRYTFLPGFDPNKNLASLDSPFPVRPIRMGDMLSSWEPGAAYKGGMGPVVSLSNTNPNIEIAHSGEFSRVTTTTIVTDVASGFVQPARLLVGGDLHVSSGEIYNQYSSISTGGGLFATSGSVQNIGQQLKKTTTITAVSNAMSLGNPGTIFSCASNIFTCTTPVGLPAITNSQVIGSLDATVATNQHLSLQAPTIVNGKAVKQLDMGPVANAVSQVSVMFDQATGQAVTTAGQSAASATGQALGGKTVDSASGQTLQGHIGRNAEAELANRVPLFIPGLGGLGSSYQPAPATQQVTLAAGGAKAGNPVAGGYAVPDNGMFHARPAPQQPYLVETNPQFTQYSNFVSSDYLLKQLNYDPSKVEKRLGDGFYEQQLVSRAVTDLTGKRFLSGYGNAMEQYQQLMSNGAQYAKQFQLTPGMALSADQMARLTSDMVWLVKQNVGGQDVLVPMVYLANADQKSLRGQGAVLAGNSMSLLASGDLVNSGTLKSDTALLAQANNIRIEGGKVQAGGDLGLSAKQDLIITDDAQHSQAGSSVKAGGDMQLQAGNDLKLQAVALDASGSASLQAGRDLDIASRETRYALGGANRYGGFQYQQTDHVGSQLNIGGSLMLSAGNDLTLSGSGAKAGGSVLALAGNSLTLESTLDSQHGAGNWWGGGYDTLSQNRNASLLQGGGDVLLKSGGDLSLSGSSAQSTGGSLAALAGKQLTVQSQVNSKHDSGYNWSNSHNWQTDKLTVAGLSGKNGLQLQAGGDAQLNGASLASGGKLALSAGNDILLGAVATESRNDNTWGERVRNNYDLTQHGTSVQGEGGLILQAGRDIATHAAGLRSDGEATLAAGRDINLGTAANQHSDYSKTVTSSGGFLKHKTTVDISAHQSATQVGTNLSADKLTVSAGHDLDIVGSQVAGSDAVRLAAGNNVNILAGTNTSQSFQYHHEKTSGVFGTGWGGFMVGSKELTDALNTQGIIQSQSKSLVGSLNGDLSVQAGGNVLLQGCGLSALTGNVDVGAKSVMVQEGRDLTVVDHSHVEKQSGFSVNAVNTLKDTFDNLKDIANTQHGFGLLKGIGTELAATSMSSGELDMSYTKSEQGYQQHTRTVNSVGSAILAGGDISLQASGKPVEQVGDITVVGAQLKAGNKVDLFANGKVDILAGVNEQQSDSSSYSHTTRLSLYTPQIGDAIRAMEGGPNHSGTSLTPYNQSRQDSQSSQNGQQLNGSQIQGEQIRVVSLGGDVNVAGSSLQAVHDVAIAASQGNVNIGAATANYQFNQDSKGFTLGNVGGGNHSATIGVQHTEDTAAGHGSTQSSALSQIVSQQGNVTLSAADAINVAGAQLQAGQDLSLSGKAVHVAPGVDQDSRVETHHMDQWGITATVSSPILTAMDAATNMGQIAAGGQNADSRTRALATGTAALAAYNGYQAVQSATNGQLVSGSVTIGASHSDSKQETQSQTHAGTSLSAGRDLMLQASGGKDSNIDVLGSQLQAGRNVTLQADKQVNLLSAQDSSSLHGESSGSSWGVGIGGSFGQNGFSFGITANASRNAGHENGNTVDQRDTTVNAGQTLHIQSGGDTTLKGAEARGQTIVADVGGKLDIESLQDQHQYHSSNQSMGGSVTVGYGFSASANYSQQKMDNDYASVQHQSGLKAGDGGYQVTVKGNTNLAGGVIAGSDKAVADGKNSLSTGTLTVSDVQNHANSSGSSVGLGVSGSWGSGSGGKSADKPADSAADKSVAQDQNGAQPATGPYGVQVQKYDNGGSVVPTGVMAAHESEDSTTRAGISGGKLTITDGAAQQALTGQTAEQATAAVNRNVSSDKDGANALKDKFDKQQLQTAFAVVQTLTDQVGTFTANKAAEAKAAKDLADKANADPSLTQAQKDQLQAQAADAAKWAPGGEYSQILTAATAGIGGNVANGLSGMAQNAGIAYLQGLGAQKVKEMADQLEKDGKPMAESETVRAVLHAAVACAGAEASGQSCGAGAAGGAASVALNNALDLIQHTDAEKMTAEEKLQRENLVSGLLTGLAAGTGGADTAATTVNAAKTEMENNAFADWQIPVRGGPEVQAAVKAGEKKGSTLALRSVADQLPVIGTILSLKDAENATDVVLALASSMPDAGLVVSLAKEAKAALAAGDIAKAKKYLNEAESGILSVCTDGACFVAGTPILTDKGLKAVETFVGGELVWARDDQTGEYGFRPVVAHKATVDQDIFRVVVEDAAGKQEVLRTTAEHPFWIKDWGWRKAALLQPGMTLLDKADGLLTVISQGKEDVRETVFNIQVTEFQTYHVGELGVWVHNAKCCPELDKNVGKQGSRRLPVPEATVAENGLAYKSNEKHTPGAGGGGAGGAPRGIEPRNSLDLFDKSVGIPGTEARYTMDESGGVHRFFDDNAGTYHWSGSTGDARAPLKIPERDKAQLRKLGWKIK